MEPGSSTGGFGVDGTEVERGRLGSGFSTETGLEKADTHGAGDRRMSLTAICKVDAALVTYVAEKGLGRYCLLSPVVTMVRPEGALRPVLGVD